MLEDSSLVQAKTIPEWHKHCVKWTGGDVWILMAESRCEEESGVCVKCTTNELQTIQDSDLLIINNNIGVTQDIFSVV